MRAVAEDVAEPRAGHQQHRVGDHVAGDDELQAGPGRVQAGMDRRGGDVDYGGVQHRHELPGQDDRQDRARAGGARRLGRRAPGPAGGAVSIGHGTEPAALLIPGTESLVILVLAAPGNRRRGPGRMGVMSMVTTVNGQHRRAELAAFLRSRRERISPEQAGLAAGHPAPHPGPAPRGGRAARRGRRDLVHVAGAGPPDQRQRPGARRGGAHAAAGPGRAGAPVPAGRRARRGRGRRDAAPAASRSRPRSSRSWTRWRRCPPACSTSGSTCSPGTPRTRSLWPGVVGREPGRAERRCG